MKKILADIFVANQPLQLLEVLSEFFDQHPSVTVVALAQSESRTAEGRLEITATLLYKE